VHFHRVNIHKSCPSLCSGTYISLFILPMIHMGANGDVGRRLGMFTTIVAIGALTGPPISGAINNSTNGFGAVGIYAGLSFELFMSH
jgi:MFS transporter, MCT family, solute carrier family 16 (monocarboxylic acid transporters), member 10